MICPPLKAHLCDHGLGRCIGSSCDFNVEGIEWPKRKARVGRCRHRCCKTIRITLLDNGRAGEKRWRKRHAGFAPSRTSFHVIESRSASKLASTMFGLTPTVDQR